MASWKKDNSGNWTKSGSSKKNYTIIDGKKVEQTTVANTPSATKSDTWNKDTVTLEEAKQQTSDVQKGVINPDTGSTSLNLAESKETISLEQAVQQTQTEVRPATDTSAAKTTNYVNDAGDVVATKVENTSYVPIKAGSGVRQSAETVTKVQKSGDEAVIEYVDNGTPYVPEKVPSTEGYEVPYTPSPVKPEYMKQQDAIITDPAGKYVDGASSIVSKVTGWKDSVEDKFNNSWLGKTDQKILNAIGIDSTPTDIAVKSVGVVNPALNSNVWKGAAASTVVLGSAAINGAIAGATNGAVGSMTSAVDTKEYGVTGYWKESAFAAAEGVRVAGDTIVDAGAGAAKNLIEEGAPYNPQLNVINTGMKAYDAGVDLIADNKKSIDNVYNSLEHTKYSNPALYQGITFVKALTPERHSEEVGASFVKGAVVDTTAMAVAIVPSIPFYAESAVKDPTGRAIDTASGVGAVVGSIVYQAKEDPARLAGMVVGTGVAEALGKTAGIKLYDRARTVGKTEIPIENLVTPDTLKGDGIYRVPEGTTTPQVMEMFKNTEAKYPGSALPKGDAAGSENLWAFNASSNPLKEKLDVRAQSARPGDDFGLFVSPENANIYFTRAESKFELFGKASDSNAGMRPTLNFVQINKVKRLPEAVRYDVGEARVFEVPESMKGGATRTFGRDLQGNDVRNIDPSRKYNFEEKYGYGKPSDMSKFDKKQKQAWDKQFEEIGWESQPTNYRGETAVPSETYVTAKMERGLARGASVEPEAVVIPGTKLVKNKGLSKYYTNYKGRRVTIDVMELKPEGSKIVTEGSGRKLVDMPGNSNKMKVSELNDAQFTKEYKPVRRGLITERTIRDASIGNIYSKRKSGVMGFNYAGSQENYKPGPSGYIPKSNKYIPKTDNYLPKTDQYIPKTSGYSPKSNNYIPKTDNYLPKTDQYIPKTSGYSPKRNGYTPKESDSFLIPAIDMPRRKSRKSKDGRFKSNYDRLYNQYGDISKWRGF
ncbi:hypothetical protein [uncultured Methanomethylovorans sp.]|uniref:hypothetical protein n=1 Tax=uncultured Methanomethylovorans sp. TaxID=183759 RepID=UPI002AA65B4B|nr:hypothetical protein [uncultured Methanomethylovorans sp.]